MEKWCFRTVYILLLFLTLFFHGVDKIFISVDNMHTYTVTHLLFTLRCFFDIIPFSCWQNAYYFVDNIPFQCWQYAQLCWASCSQCWLHVAMWSSIQCWAWCSQCCINLLSQLELLQLRSIASIFNCMHFQMSAQRFCSHQFGMLPFVVGRIHINFYIIIFGIDCGDNLIKYYMLYHSFSGW
jgi:hypothetical protein